MSRAAERRFAFLILLALPCVVAAGPPPAATADGEADEDLLEFLGGVGGEDADFTDYLSRTDVAQATKPPPKPAPPPPPEVKKS